MVWIVISDALSSCAAWRSRDLQPRQTAPGLLLSLSLSLNSSSSVCPSTSPSPSRVCPLTCPCTLHPATSQRRSCTCWRAACTAGGARWRMIHEVQRLKPNSAQTHTHFPHTRRVQVHALTMYLCGQIFKGVYPESTEPLTSCTRTRR